MAEPYDDRERERIRKVFAKCRRNEEESIAYCCEKAGISTSTYYAWNKGDGWNKGKGWNKGNG